VLLLCVTQRSELTASKLSPSPLLLIPMSFSPPLLRRPSSRITPTSIYAVLVTERRWSSLWSKVQRGQKQPRSRAQMEPLFRGANMHVSVAFVGTTSPSTMEWNKDSIRNVMVDRSDSLCVVWILRYPAWCAFHSDGVASVYIVTAEKLSADHP